QLVFGRRRIRGDHVREEPGLIHRAGVVWIGQSVLAMPVKEADDFASRLRRLGVRVAVAPMTIPRESLEAFRRPRAYLLTRRRRPAIPSIRTVHRTPRTWPRGSRMFARRGIGVRPRRMS